MFRPRVLRNMGDVDASRKIFGHNSLYPFYISLMGILGTINSEAELDVVRGAVKKGVHMVPASDLADPQHYNVLA
jgi:L-lactate dehydrogenase (cytochrome)